MKPLVELFFDLHQDFYHASALYAGLDLLAKKRLIRLRYRRPTNSEKHFTADTSTVCLRVSAGTAEPSLIAIDLHDQSHLFADRILPHCDVYLKRSYYEPDLQSLPDPIAAKIHPFGMNYACRTLGSTIRLFQNAYRLVFRGFSGLWPLRVHVALVKCAGYEQSPSEVLNPTIVFQTRVWEEHDTAPGETEEINEGRVAVIRALKDAFGDRFQGGLVPSPLALKRYPREVSVIPARRRQYTAMSKRNLIGIYTRGLHFSTAFKLPEYLAAAQCIVAETPRNALPVPLVPGSNFLPFQSPDECVKACQRLLVDNELAARMRHANYEYYRKEVEPSSHFRSILERYAGLEFQS